MIACRDCNTGVGDMTAREKIEYIVQRRLMKIMPAA